MSAAEPLQDSKRDRRSSFDDEHGDVKRRKVESAETGTGSGWFSNTIARVGFALDQRFAGVLIGKKGATAKRLYNDSGLKNIKFGEGAIEKTEYQLLVMRGSPQAIRAATIMVCETMDIFAQRKAKDGDPVSEQRPGIVHVKMMFPDRTVPMMIGKKGSKIRSLQADFDLDLTFEEESVLGEKLLSIKGTPHDIGEFVTVAIRSLPSEDFTGIRPAFESVGLAAAEEKDPAAESEPRSRPPPRSRYDDPYARRDDTYSRRDDYPRHDDYPRYDAYPPRRGGYDYEPEPDPYYTAPRSSYGAPPPADYGPERGAAPVYGWQGR